MSDTAGPGHDGGQSAEPQAEAEQIEELTEELDTAPPEPEGQDGSDQEGTGQEDPTATADATAFERLLVYLKDVRGFDFTGYKRPSLLRRVRHRMRAVNIDTFDEYQDF